MGKGFFKNSLWLLGLMAISNFLNAQDYTFSGVVQSNEGKPLKGATVLFGRMNQDSLRSTTNQEGIFNFSSTHSLGSGNLIISYVGYSTLISHVNTDSLKKSPVVFKLFPKDGLLENVTIESNKIQIKEDTVSYVVDSTMYRKNDNVEEVLKKLPGVTVDKDGTVTAQGKQVTKVKVNGKDFFNGDVTTATRQINADMVDRIQIIDDYGDQAAFTGVKDGDPSKTLNIQLKKDKNKGYFGNVSAGAGTEDRYLINASFNLFKNSRQISLLGNLNNTNANTFNFGSMGLSPSMARMVGGAIRSFGMGGPGSPLSGFGNTDGISINKSIGLNYRDEWGKKSSFYGSYSFSHKTTYSEQQISQQNFYAQSSNINHQDLVDNTGNNNHRVNLNLEYRIDSFNYLKISPGFTFNDGEETSNNRFSYFDSSGRKTNDGNTFQDISNNAPGYSGSVLYNHRFRRKGRYLSINGSGNTNSTDNGNDYTNNASLYTQVGVTIDTSLNQFTQQENRASSYSIKASYIEPLDKKRSLEINYAYSHQYTSNNKKTYNVDMPGQARTYLDSLSNIYENNYYTHRFGLNFRTVEKKFNYAIGMGVQPAIIKSNSETGNYAYTQHLLNFYPVIRFAYNFSRSRSLSMNYNGNTNQPGYQQLQPVTDYSNPQYITVGNPNLKPEFNNSFSLRYNNFDFITGDVFFSFISFSFTKDKIVNNVFNRGFGVQETRYLNTNGYYTVTGFYNYSKPWRNRKYVLNYGGNIIYNNNISYLQDKRNKGANWVVGQRLSTDIMVKKWLETTVGVNFNLNSSHYKIQKSLNSQTIGWTLTNTTRIFLPKNFRMNYDLEKDLNSGYANSVKAEPFIINAGIEKAFLKNEKLSVKFQGLDILNQNKNLSRSVTANSITDIRANRLQRYFMVSATYRLNKFGGGGGGKQGNMPVGMPLMRMQNF